MSATSCLYVTCPLKTLKIPYKIPEDTRTNATIPSTYPIRGTASSSIGPITSQINVLKNGKEIYSLADALQDMYLCLKMEEAMADEYKPVYTEKQPWNSFLTM